MRVFALFNLIIPDQRTDGPTDRWTDKASYRVACPQLKTWFQRKFTILSQPLCLLCAAHNRIPLYVIAHKRTRKHSRARKQVVFVCMRVVAARKRRGYQETCARAFLEREGEGKRENRKKGNCGSISASKLKEDRGRVTAADSSLKDQPGL